MEFYRSNESPGGAVPPVRRGVVGVVLDGRRLLVIRRSQHVRAPGAYCFPGGGIEEGETETAALLREMDEELAVRVRPVRRIWESVTGWGVHLAWWLCELEQGECLRPNPAEVESIHWLELRSMSELNGLLQSNHEFLAAVACGQIRLSD